MKRNILLLCLIGSGIFVVAAYNFFSTDHTSMNAVDQAPQSISTPISSSIVERDEDTMVSVISNPIDDSIDDSETQENPVDPIVSCAQVEILREESSEYRLLKPIPAKDWKEVTFEQTQKGMAWIEPDNVLTDVISLKIPQNWTLESTNFRSNAGMGGADCYDYDVKNEQETTILTIAPVCGSYSESEVDVANTKQSIIGYKDNQGDDSHDEIIVRYEDDNLQRYGTYSTDDIAAVFSQEDETPVFNLLENVLVIESDLFPMEGVGYLWMNAELLDSECSNVTDAIINSIEVTSSNTSNT